MPVCVTGNLFIKLPVALQSNPRAALCTLCLRAVSGGAQGQLGFVSIKLDDVAASTLLQPYL